MKNKTQNSKKLLSPKAGALYVPPTKEHSTPTISGVNPMLAAIRTELLVHTFAPRRDNFGAYRF